MKERRTKGELSSGVEERVRRSERRAGGGSEGWKAETSGVDRVGAVATRRRASTAERAVGVLMEWWGVVASRGREW